MGISNTSNMVEDEKPWYITLLKNLTTNSRMQTGAYLKNSGVLTFFFCLQWKSLQQTIFICSYLVLFLMMAIVYNSLHFKVKALNIIWVSKLINLLIRLCNKLNFKHLLRVCILTIGSCFWRQILYPFHIETFCCCFLFVIFFKN